MGLFDGWRVRVAELEARIAALESRQGARDLEHDDYLSKLRSLYKRVDQRARVIERTEQQLLDIEEPTEHTNGGESVMDMRRRFGR